MGLRETFQAAAVTAVRAFGDVALSCTYRSFSSSGYNTSTGTASAVYGEQGSVLTIFDTFEVREVDGDRVLSTDKLAMIASPDLSVTPKAADRIIDPDGTTWEVIAIRSDPADALWLLQVRSG